VTHYHPRRDDAPPPRVSMILDVATNSPGPGLPRIEQGRSSRFKLDVTISAPVPRRGGFAIRSFLAEGPRGVWSNAMAGSSQARPRRLCGARARPAAFSLRAVYRSRHELLEGALVPLTVFTPWYANTAIMLPSGAAIFGLIGWAFVARSLVTGGNGRTEQLREQMLSNRSARARVAVEKENADESGPN